MNRSTAIVAVLLVLLLIVGVVLVFRSQLARFLPHNQPAATQPEPTPDVTLGWQEFATSTYALRFPPEFMLNSAYAYDQFGPTKLIRGISLTIPASLATGTNLSAETRLSVEQLPRAKKCTADIFINADVPAYKLTDAGTDYSLATTSGAGAGNLYEETVYALSTSSPCTAVRYLVHSSNLGNYPEGAVRAFDRAPLLSIFDTIRRTVQMR